MGMRCIKLYSDNFEGVILTEDAYRAVTCDMSNGDFGTHNAVTCIAPEGEAKTYNDLCEIAKIKKPKQKRSKSK